jgi:micrococcal nuclease
LLKHLAMTWMMFRLKVLVVAMGLALAAVSVACAEPGGEPAGCATSSAGRATRAPRIDHSTLILDDARVVRLAGVNFPVWTRTGGMAADPARIVRAALAGWVLGRSVEILQERPGTDRYGRLVAQIRFELDGRPAWVQALLAGEGLMLVEAGEGACAGALLAFEQAARSAGKGFWGSGLFRVRQAREASLMRGLVNTFQIVEGSIVGISESAGAIYVNFGSNWKTDFTAVVRRGRRADLKFVVTRLKQTRKRPVRIRGWLKWRNGPLIEIEAPHQIEFSEGPRLPSSPGRAKDPFRSQPLPSHL